MIHKKPPEESINWRNLTLINLMHKRMQKEIIDTNISNNIMQ